MKFLYLLICILACLSAAELVEAAPASAVNYHISFEDMKFMENDFVARSGLKSIEERGLVPAEGKFGRGLMMSLIPTQADVDNLSGIDLDPITAVMFNTTIMRDSMVGYNEPILWGTGKINPASGAVAFWVKGKLSEGVLFEQTACAWGRKERYLLGITSDTVGSISAYLMDARYVKHVITSTLPWDDREFNHVALNWNRSQGLELFINGKSVASSWGKDAWWETALPGLLRFPMPQVVYDEMYFFSRPLTLPEIDALMKTNTPPPALTDYPERTPQERDRLERALGITVKSMIPLIEPMEAGRILSFREVSPVSMGDGHIPAQFCQDGRYELAWPHPIGVFTIIPGDEDFTAEKLDVDPPPGIPFNYVTVEGNLADLPVYTNCTRTQDRFSGDTLIGIPKDSGFFYGELVDRKERGRITLPFLKGYGVPDGFRGDMHLPLTGETRVHEVGLFDVVPKAYVPVPGEATYYLQQEGELNDRYGFALAALNPGEDRGVLQGYQAPGTKPSRMLATGLLRRTNIITTPLTGTRCIGGVILDMPVKTSGADLLLVRLRDPGVPSRIWTHAEVKLMGFESGGRLRLLMDFTPLMLSPGDRIWLDIATLNGAQVSIGGADGAKILLRTAPFAESAPLFEKKELLPAVAEYSRTFGYLPWKFDKTSPVYTAPFAFGGPFDILYSAQAVKRFFPWSRDANFYLEFTKPIFSIWGEIIEPEKNILLRQFDIPSNIPRWAFFQQRIQSFRYRILEWIGANQNPDGQLGGGWNDDNDMLMGKLDMFLDGSLQAKNIQARMYAGLDSTGYVTDGYCHITPIDRLHVSDLWHDRFRTLMYRLGDPSEFRRALRTAWRWDKPFETPMNWGRGESFLYDKNILEWYWGKNLPQAAFSLTDTAAVQTRLLRLASFCDHLTFYQFTEARIYTDCQVINDEGLITQMIVGGNVDSTASVEWVEGGGEDLARWVTYADSVSFVCRIFSNDPLQRKVTPRLYRIQPGTYEVKLTEDLDGIAGRPLFTGDFELNRFDTFSLLLPSMKPVILSVKQVKSAEGVKPLPDLALAPYDCVRQKAILRVRVSNLGAAPSEKTTIRLYDAQDRRLDELKVPEIPAPVDFVEKSEWIFFENVPEKGNLRLVIDPRVRMKEIYKGNNEVVVE
ncbi:MAG: LamG-like jellyroll fold domain-containing protein [Candidatus Latescibacter sp.]|nr:LamG-like jellyroll fold domain-containing protein [Candidatus Latescibacter sp.]